MRRGFTLIELLVTVAIVAVIAAILIPLFSGCGDDTVAPVSTITFTGTVQSVLPATEEDDDGNMVTVVYADVQADNDPKIIKYSVEHTLTLEPHKKYAFRVWPDATSPHIGEAIPLP